MAKFSSLLPTFMFACLLFHLIFNIRLDVAVRDGRYHLFVFDMIPILLKASIVDIDTDMDTDTILLNWTFKLWNLLYY